MSKAWQSYSYSFPSTTYCALYFVDMNRGSSNEILVPDNELFRSKEDILTSIVESNQKFAKNGMSEEILPNPMVIEMALDRLFPLTRDMWHDDGLPYDLERRIADFAKVLKWPELYWIVVVPLKNSKGTEQFRIALPIPISTADEEIQRLMHTVKIAVDEKATHFSLYRYRSFHQYNPEKQKWVEKRKDWGTVEQKTADST